MTEKAGGRKKSGKVRETGSSRSPNAPSEDRKCWQRLELGIQDLKSGGRISPRKVRATGIQTAFQVTKETSRPLRPLPPDVPELSSCHPRTSRRAANPATPGNQSRR